MRFARALLLAAVAATAAAVSVSDAKAGDFSHGLPYFGYGYSGSLYGLGYVPVPPYFAIHPPVYYGDRYARPYGVSPFASQCDLKCNDSYMAVPDGANVEDYRPLHHMGSMGVRTGMNQRTAKARPLSITNPFYAPNGADSRPVVAEVITNPYVQESSTPVQLTGSGDKEI